MLVIAEEFFQREGYDCNGGKVPLAFPGAARKYYHNFDFSHDKWGQRFICECKAHQWRKHYNAPSFSAWNETMYLFHLAPSDYVKFFFAVKSENDEHTTLIDYYLKTYAHLIPANVLFLEWDPDIEECDTYVFNGKRWKRTARPLSKLAGWPPSWSNKLKDKTLYILKGLDVDAFMNAFMRDCKCFMKHFDGAYGTISLEHASAREWIIDLLDGGGSLRFASVAELIAADWVVD
jgi:hypothetical protein